MFAVVKLIFFSGDPKPPLITKVGPSPIIKKLFLRLSDRDDELISASKTITFLAKSLSKIPESVAPYPLCKYFPSSLFSTILEN